jgi:colicin import membrane protein
MADESDGVIEEAGGQMRIALMAATQMAEKFSRLREELTRRAQAQAEQQTRELRARFDADRNAARATVAPTARPEWWNTASVQDVAETYQTARAWEPVDEDLAKAAQHMRDEVRDRYGVDVDVDTVRGANELMRDALVTATARADEDRPTAEDPMRRMLSDLEEGRADARAAVDPVYRSEWWDEAGVADVAAAYEAAHAWEDVDTDIAAHAQQMRYEIQNRYGLDVEAMHDRPDAVATAVAEVRREQEPSPVRDAMREFDAQLDAVRADVGATADARWWDTATPEQVAATYEKAAAWEGLDPEVARSAERMRTELRDRYGVENAGAGQAALRDAVERDQRTRGDAAQQRTAAGGDVAQAGAYVAAADRLDREGDRRDREQYERDQADATRGDIDDPLASVTNGPGSPGDDARRGAGSPEHAAADANRDAADDSYDSAGRREAWAADMEADGLSADQVQGRIAADRNQATHPRQAVQSKPRTSKARVTSQTQGLQRERGGLSR